MTQCQTIAINRYCAIADGVCHEAGIEFKGERSCFLGYPFTPAYVDSMDQLKKRLRDLQSIDAALPTDVWEGGVIFCKLCREIYANNFILTEVTDLNRNVLFEHGYATAVRRHGLLLRDSTKISEDFPLLKDVEQVYYENRDDILRHTAKFQIDDQNPSDRPLRLIGMCQTCEIEQRYNLIYSLKNGSRSDAVRAIDKLLRKEHFFDVVDDNPNDIGGHEVHQYCKRVQQARYVVAHFVSDDRKDHQVLNARVAFLMGLAMGFGKRILILQETPIGKKMIDLKGVIREYDGESQLRTIVKEWLDKERSHVISVAELKKDARRKRGRRKAVTLRDLDFGPAAAEKDFDLPKYFVETPYFKRAQRGDRTLFVGRRGSGKTAMFMLLTEDLMGPNNVVVDIAPRDYELLRLEGFLTEEFSTAHWRFVYGSIWRNVLLTEIVQKVIEYQQENPSLPISNALGQLMRFHDQNRDMFDLSFTDRLTYTIEQLEELTPHSNTDRNQEQVEHTLKSIRFLEIENMLRDFTKERRVYVLIDHLDASWSTDNEQTCLLVAGLIHEADRLNTYVTPDLRIIVFLRSDIFDVVKVKDSEVDKRSKDTIRWTSALLKEMIARRIGIAKGFDLDGRGVEEAWHDVFCTHVGEEDTIAYILDRTLLRPRDVLQFCNRCLEAAQNERHDYVHEDDVLRAEESYSEDMILGLFGEYAISHPDLIELLWLFMGLPVEIEELEIAQLIREAQRDPDTLKTAREWINDYTTERLIHFLYEIGFLCVKLEDGRFINSSTAPLEKATLNGLQLTEYEVVEDAPFVPTIRGVYLWLRQSLGLPKRVVRQQRVFSIHPALRHHLRIG